MCLIKSSLVFDYKTNKTLRKAGKCPIYEWILPKVHFMFYFSFGLLRHSRECLELQTHLCYSELIDLFLWQTETINIANKSNLWQSITLMIFFLRFHMFFVYKTTFYAKERTSFCMITVTQSIFTIYRTFSILLVFNFLWCVVVTIKTVL